MRSFASLFFVLLLLAGPTAHASIFGQVRGIVHDQNHRPIAGARVELRAANSDLLRSVQTAGDGSFSLLGVPLGVYIVTASQAGFTATHQAITVASETSSVLHFELALAGDVQSVDVTTQTGTVNVDSATPTTLIDRVEIGRTPGATRTDSLAMITDYVPGAYITHDMLHIRGGHQVSWLIDGVPIPNTNIASNLGAQIDPKNIDYIEVQRGSYTASLGDRTYGVFNVVPRTGFERDREAELVLSAGSFLQSNDQLSLGSHTRSFAWYASLDGNRSDFGLQTPIARIYHDATNGYGAFASLIDNRTPADQLRLVTQVRNDFFQIPYDPQPNPVYNSSGLRDSQHETDDLVVASWTHTFNASTLLQVSPFFHANSADYQPGANDLPVASTSDRSSLYAGTQASLSTEFAHNLLQAGLFGFGQHDSYKFAATFNDGSSRNLQSIGHAPGGVVEQFLSDNYKLRPWLTLIAGVRHSSFAGQISEDATTPRFGIAVQVPRLNWVFRGFYGRFYQPPPLLTESGPLLQYARQQNTTLVPLHGERDEEHQFGVQIPLHGWQIDVDNFRTRAGNFLDHSSLGESSLYFPVTLQGALIRAWELSLSSPQQWRFGHAHLAYSNQIAEQRGPITGGLICYPITSPQCDVLPGYTPLDHDQRNTLSVGFDTTLPRHIFTSANFSYGSGFTNGNPSPAYPGSYLPANLDLDLSLGKTFHKSTTLSLSAVNVMNDRVLLDNSLTFGGFHFNNPREIFGEVRYRFHY